MAELSRPDLFDLAGKTCLVTGAGSGLGRAFAEGFAAYGADVICADRDEEGATETALTIGESGGTARPLHVDVADHRSVEKMVRACGPRIDVLVNNAGIATPARRMHEIALDDWNRLIGINLTGVFHCTRAVVPAMIASGGGSIVNIASILGLVGHYPGFAMVTASYAAAKAGVIGFTRQVALEYAKDGIRCNAIAPGWHGGTKLGNATKQGMNNETMARFEDCIVDGVPMGRRGTPDELQGLAIYLASGASSYVTGQVFTQDGGWTAT
jgi:NAD(P)-dependent dehydrogenase (short-subunit alcohol dehydrogenase family)